MILIFLFIFGLLSALGALLFELAVASFLIDPTAITQVTFIPDTFSLLLFALIEESSKLVFLLQAKKRFQSIGSFLPAGIAFGLGFTSLEYFWLSFLSTLPSGPFYGILLLHVITTCIMTFFLTKTAPKKALLGLLLALTLIHFGYNILL